MASGFIGSYLKELKMDFEILEWKPVILVFIATIIMAAILVVMLPDRPLEFW